MKNSIKFLPLLLFYIFIVLVSSTNAFQDDEFHYASRAENLSRGFYSGSNDMNLLSGPGYPVILVPFVLLKLPWIFAKLLNALFLFGAIVYFYRALRFYIQARPASIFAYALGIYPPLMRYVHLLMTESFSIFLIAGFLFYFCRLYNDDKNKRASFPAASFYLGYLALTKVYFGYVILAISAMAALLYLWKKAEALKKTLLVYLLALLFCLPYLYYTYSLTGRVFYWGNSGGMSLYWMSTPHDGEFGDWHNYSDLGANSQLAKNHGDFFKRISSLNYVKKDDEFKKQAIYNISRNPVKFLKNWIANIGRMLFSYPFSYTSQKLSTLFYLIPNMFIAVFSLLSVYASCRGRKLVPHEIYMSVLFAFVTFGGSTLLSAYSRQFTVIVPIFAFWIFFTLTRILKIEIRG